MSWCNNWGTPIPMLIMVLTGGGGAMNSAVIITWNDVWWDL